MSYFSRLLESTSFNDATQDQCHDTFSNEADIDEEDTDDIVYEDHDYHSLPTDWPPQYSPQSSSSSTPDEQLDEFDQA